VKSLPAPRQGISIPAHLSESEWQDLRTVIRQDAGIKLSEAKRVFLVSRLLKRLRATGAKTFREYFRIVTQKGCASDEHQRLINAVTTNKTDFFREPEHFEVLADWLKSASGHAARMRGVRVWCAASSTGEEPYTLAAVLKRNLTDSEWRRVSVLASDIDTAVLTTARRGVYTSSVVAPVESMWKAMMFVQGSGDRRNEYRVRRELREHVTFAQVNLNELAWDVAGTFDVVFCRNVLIYFDRATQERVVKRLLDIVDPAGLLFLGHSESINGMAIAAQGVAHAVYKHTNAAYCAPKGVIRQPSVAALRAAPLVQSAQQLQQGCAWRMLRDREPPLEVQLESACLLFMYSDGAGKGFVAVVERLRSADDALERTLQAAALGARQLLGDDPAKHIVKAKLIVSSGPLEFRDPVEQRFGATLNRNGIELVAFRHKPEAVTAIVSPATRKIQVQLVSSSVGSLGRAPTRHSTTTGATKGAS
jgi:chemotaxis protein methyltransferase CheR